MKYVGYSTDLVTSTHCTTHIIQAHCTYVQNTYTYTHTHTQTHTHTNTHTHTCTPMTSSVRKALSWVVLTLLVLTVTSVLHHVCLRLASSRLQLWLSPLPFLPSSPLLSCCAFHLLPVQERKERCEGSRLFEWECMSVCMCVCVWS